MSWPTSWGAVEIRALLTVRRDSYQSLGEHLGASGETVRRWATGGQPPTHKELLRALDATLAELEPWQRRWFDELFALAPGSQVEVDAGWIPSDGQEAGTKRGDFLKLVAAFACTPAPLDAIEHVAASIGSRPSIDDGLLVHCGALTTALARSYEQVAPARLAQTAHLHCERLGRLLAEPMSPSQRQRLVRCAGDTATLVGWLTFYAGRPEVARKHLERARTLARETGDLTLHAQALGSLSILDATTADGGRSGDPAAALELLEEANARARHAPGIVRAWVAARLAEEHAAAGDADDYRRMIEHARIALDIAVSEQATEGFLAVFSGWETMAIDGFEGICYVLLGRPHEAEAALRHRLTLADGGMWRATALTDLGAALTMQGEPEMTCEALGEALTLVVVAGNTMGVERIRGVRARFPGTWAPLECVVELDERLRLAA